jgi:hypothetical protein
MLSWIIRAGTRRRERKRAETVVLTDAPLFGEGIGTVFDVPERRETAPPRRPTPPR